MTQPTFTRRASYGPTSPTVGTRGARKRQQIVHAALSCFTERSFHDTSVDDIASRANASRATLYQYFESKDEIFIELMHESGDALCSLTKQLSGIGPDTEGYANLHCWLYQWAQTFDQYAAMFIEWANVNSPQAPLRPKLASFVDHHTKLFNQALDDADYRGSNPSHASILTLALINRFNYLRHVYRPGLSAEQLLDSLAIAVQLFLFPQTPRAVLAAGPLPAHNRNTKAVARQPATDIRPLAQLPDRGTIYQPTPFEGLSPKATLTVRHLLDAAGRVFAASGYNGANIDHIVTEAGLARGTFYRYFSNKLELIATLAWEAAAEMRPLFDEFHRFSNNRNSDDLCDWLRRFLAVQRRYTGVLRAWTEGFPIDETLLVPAADVVAAMGQAITATFGPRRPYPLDRRAAGMLFAGLLEHFPNEGTGAKHEPTDEQIIETQACFIERVLFPDY